MKYVVFAAALLAGVPAMAIGAASLSRVRGWLVTLLIFSTVLGHTGSINFISMELYRGPDRGFEVCLTDLICWALIAALVIRFPRKLAWLPYNSIPLLAFFALACAALFYAPQPLYAAFTVFKLVRVYLVFWCVVNCVKVGVDRKFIWMGICGAAAVLLLLTLHQKYVLGIYRVPGPFDHSNTIPPYVNLILPLLLMWALCDRALTRIEIAVSLVLCVGMLFTVLSTFSRAGLAISVVCVLAAVLWANLRASSLRVRFVSLALAVVLLAGGVRAASSIIARIHSAPKESAEARDEFKYAAALMLRDHPFGVGLNNFTYVLTETPQYRERFRAMANEEQAGVAHHIYWLTAAELGYAGIFVFLLVMVRFTWHAWRNAWRRRNIESHLLFGCFIGFMALHSSGLFEWVFRITPVTNLFAICAGLSVAWADQVTRHSSTRLSIQAAKPRPGRVLEEVNP